MKSYILCHGPSFESVREYIEENKPKAYKERRFSIQHEGQGWQAHPWVGIIYWGKK